MKAALGRILLALSAAGCSTVANPAGERWCSKDADCYTHERCSQAHGGRCVSRQLPRRPSFGLAGIAQVNRKHGELPIPWEFQGCEIDAFDPDTGVSRINLERKLRPLHLGNLSYSHPYQSSCAASCAPQAFCDPINGQCAFARHGVWTIQQESRLGLAPLQTRISVSAPHPEGPQLEHPPSLALPWPCGSHGTWIKESQQALSAQMHTPTLGVKERLRFLAPTPCAQKGERTLESAFHDLSWRSSRRPSPQLDLKPLLETGAESDQQASLRFDLEWVWPKAQFQVLKAKTRPGVRADDERSCEQDQDCPTLPAIEVYCSKAGRCKTRSGRVNTLRSEALSPGLQAMPRHRGESLPSLVTVHPRDSTLARMQVSLEASDSQNPLLTVQPSETQAQRLCLPRWTLPASPRAVKLRSSFGPINWRHHSPLPLLTGRMACNAADLARGDGQDLGPCVAPERPRIRLLSRLNAKGEEAFRRASCLLPEPLGKPFGQSHAEPVGVGKPFGQSHALGQSHAAVGMGKPFGQSHAVGVGKPFGRSQFVVVGKPFGQSHFDLELPLDCDDAGHCQVWPPHTFVAGPCYDLALELERPAGSLFRSIRQVFSRAHCKDQKPDQKPEGLSLPQAWQRRPLIRGRIQVPGERAEALHVEVLAERLNDGEDNPQGPFFFHQQIIPRGPSKGQFALPVEPGRYVVTALAHHPLQWGPAPFVIVDVRAPSVETPEIHLQMQTGPLVQVQVHAPEGMNRVRARPIDLGSWKEDPAFPDLNAPATCFPLGQGCAIRMLTAPQGRRGREIPADTRSVLRWTSRPGGPVECP